MSNNIVKLDMKKVGTTTVFGNKEKVILKKNISFKKWDTYISYI